jgi:ribose 5-phosphate isomerase B
MEKKIVIGSDASGFVLKEAVVAHLKELGYEVKDVGTLSEDKPVDYWQVGFNVGGAVSGKEFERGIVICGTGQGVSMAANKFPGVLCGLCESVFAVNRARTFNNINILGLGGFLQAPYLGIEMVDTFLNTEWKQGMDPETANLLENAYGAMNAHDKEVFK